MTVGAARNLPLFYPERTLEKCRLSNKEFAESLFFSGQMLRFKLNAARKVIKS